jgi:hypothetical protein
LIVRAPQAGQAVGHRRSVDEGPVSIHRAFSNGPATDAQGTSAAARESEMAAFASGISTDDAAVRAEISELRLNGQVEGSDRQTQTRQAPDVWPRQIRFAPSETGRQDTNPGGPKLRQTLKLTRLI